MFCILFNLPNTYILYQLVNSLMSPNPPLLKQVARVDLSSAMVNRLRNAAQGSEVLDTNLPGQFGLFFFKVT